MDEVGNVGEAARTDSLWNLQKPQQISAYQSIMILSLKCNAENGGEL
jgi:hypothetical protein